MPKSTNSPMTKPAFSRGDRVRRPKDVHKPEKGTKRGTVMEVYSRPSRDHRDWIYAVQWDKDDHVETGYLEHGLTAEYKETGF